MSIDPVGSASRHANIASAHPSAGSGPQKSLDNPGAGRQAAGGSSAGSASNPTAPPGQAGGGAGGGSPPGPAGGGGAPSGPDGFPSGGAPPSGHPSGGGGGGGPPDAGSTTASGERDDPPYFGRGPWNVLDYHWLQGEFAPNPKPPTNDWESKVNEILQLYVDITDPQLKN
eukprot:6883392-Pyramimonas_sp.AAC.1